MMARGGLSIQPSLDDVLVSCTCCAGMPGVRGFIYENAEALALYVVEPTGRVNFPSLRLGLVIGPWAESSQPRDRLAVAFSCEAGSVIRTADAFRPTEIVELGAPLLASELQAHPDFPKFLELAQAVIASDPRLDEIRKPAARPIPWPRKFLPDTLE